MYNSENKIKFGVFGCCVSRDPFNRVFVPNYKEFFEIVSTATRVSMIDLMQKPIFIDDNLIKILPDNQSNRYKSWTIQYDMSRGFLKQLLENNMDYLIIDNYLEVFFGIVCWNNQIFSYNSFLEETEFYKNLDDFTHFRMQDNPKKYFELWKKGCDSFFNFLNKNCPNLKIILHKARPIDKFKREDGSIYIDEGYSEHKDTISPLMDKLDGYISDNYDVKIIEFDEKNVFLDENHHWGKGPVHYNKEFYFNFSDDLKKIILSDLYHENDSIINFKNSNNLLTNRNKILSRTNCDLYFKNEFLNQKLIEINKINSQLLQRNEILTRTKNNLFEENQKLTNEIKSIKQDLTNKNKELLILEQKWNVYESNIFEKNKKINSIKNENKMLLMKYNSQKEYINSLIQENKSNKHFKQFKAIKSIKQKIF